MTQALSRIQGILKFQAMDVLPGATWEDLERRSLATIKPVISAL